MPLFPSSTPHKDAAGLSGLVPLICIVIIAASATAFEEGRSSRVVDDPMAVLNNFAPDLLHGDDGLPPSPRFPLKYGPVNTAIDVEGNEIDAHEAHLAYFEGKYWMYGREWGCGTMAFGRNRPEDATRNDRPECGIVSLSSPDLLRWHVADRDYIPVVNGQQVGNQKPQVVWSAPLHRYLMWFVGRHGYYIAQSTSPGGPWGNVIKPNGQYLGHDLNIMVERDGSAYVASDVMAEIVNGVPNWDVWVQKLNPELTGTTGEALRVMSHVSFEGIGFFEREGYWYLLGGHTCPNCPSTTISYLMARAPLGRWTNGVGAITSPLQPTQLSDDGCMGQDKGANVLPTPSGPIVVEGIMQYRSSPMDSGHTLVHGDNNQAIANTYWWPLQFDRDHHIQALACKASVRVPLAHEVRALPAPGVTLDTSPALPHQLDCRITSKTALEQRWTVPADTMIRELHIPVFQRTTNLGPEDQDALMNADLNARVSLPSGEAVSAAFAPQSISWSAHSVVLKLPQPLRKAGPITVTLTTKATNGCYGVVVGAPTGALPSGVYGTVVNDARRDLPSVQMVLSTVARK